MRTALFRQRSQRVREVAAAAAALLLACWGIRAGYGTTWYVDNSRHASSSESTSPKPIQSIQDAIDAASEMDTVVVSPGTYLENIQFHGKSIILRSRDPNDPVVIASTIIDGNQAGPVVTFMGMEHEPCALDGFTICDGKARRGGGILGEEFMEMSGGVSIRNNVITGNTATGGEGYDARGGGIYGCRGTIENNAISGNSAYYGGGLEGCHGIIQNNVIRENTAEFGGGLCYCRATIQNNTISGNSATSGGGLYGCEGVIQNNEISGNGATDSGGGLCYGEGTIQNNTVVANTAPWGAGLSRCHGIIRNCILWGKIGAPPQSQIDECDVPSFSCVQGWSSGTGNISEYPRFVDEVGGDYRLQADSPCVDAGWSYYWLHWPQYDLDGNCRVAGKAVDMGCYEQGSSLDSDGDLLSDSDELLWGADPNSEDTDGDGLRDGFEVLRGGQPLSPTFGMTLDVPSAVPTIRAAVHLARKGDAVVVAPGTYVENVEFLGFDVTLRSWEPQNPDVAAETIIDGGQNGPVVSFVGTETESCVVEGFTIRNGRSQRGGGGITVAVFEERTHATIRDCTISGNRADYDGGGIAYCDGMIWNNAIANNEASIGGGIAYCDGLIENNIIDHNNSSSVGGGLGYCMGTVQNNQITDNSAYHGAGLWACGGVVRDNVITGNATVSNTGEGGGVLECFGTVQGNMIAGNSAKYGGGLCRCGGIIWGNTVSGNVASEDGGGLFSCGASILNNIILGNSAAERGGGLYGCSRAIWNNTIFANTANEGGGLFNCTATIVNCIIWGNTAALSPQLDSSSSLPTYSCIEFWTRGGQGNMDFFPYFADAENGDFHLRTWSPCIDAGDPVFPFLEEPQPNGSRINIGSYGNTAEATSASPDSDQDTLPDNWETEFFGDLAQDGSGDPDGDQISNADEYRRGLDPKVPEAMPGLWYVDGAVSASGDGKSWEKAFKTIQEGIDAASHGHVVVVASGVYLEHIEFKSQNIVLRSTSPLDPVVVGSTIIDGNQTGRAVTFSGFEDETCVLSGFTIRNGTDAGGIWGGWSTNRARATIENNVISGNLGRGISACDGIIRNNTIAGNSGGGVYGCKGNIENNTITNNSAGSGGGLAYCNGTIIGNTVTGNTAAEGGGLYECNGTIENNTISGNSATQEPGYGGGLAWCDAAIAGCTISDNSARYGGGLYECSALIEDCLITQNTAEMGGAVCGGRGTVKNSTVSENQARFDGGGFRGCDGAIQGNIISKNSAGNDGGAFCLCHGIIENNLILENSATNGGGLGFCYGTIKNNTVFGNRASEYGAGLFRCSATVSIQNCIVWGNSSGSGDQVYSSGTPTYSCIQDWAGGGVGGIDYYPYFVDPANGDYHLKSRSPCIDAGDPASPFSLEPQPNGARIDMGAYGNTPEATPKSPDSDHDGLPDDWETETFGDLSQDEAGDPDGDMIPNIQEYRYAKDPNVPGTMWYVNASTPASGDGQSWQTAFKTIQEGIDAAIEGDTVVVAQGVCRENIRFDGKNVRLTSVDPFDAEVVAATVIDGNRSGSVVTFAGTENETCLLSGFTIRNGQAESGAGIQGGTWETYTRATIRNNLIVDNVAFGDDASGGGLASCHGIIENNVIARNAAPGKYAHGGGLTYCNGLIRNNTIADNRSTNDGGGLDRCSGTIRNCIIWGNRSRSRVQLYESSPPSYFCIEDWLAGGTGNIFLNPRFVNAAALDYRLESWSPCIDAGDPSSPYANEPEPNGGRIDMGAYGNTPDATPKSGDSDADGLPDDWEFHEFANLAQNGTGDPDGDGIANAVECRFGWDPLAVSATLANNATRKSGYQTIQAALHEAADGDEIVVSPGTYIENISFLGKNVLLRGTDPAVEDVVNETIIDGSRAGVTVLFNGRETSDCVLSGLTIANGYGLYGGGICGNGTHATIQYNLISDNLAWNEGGGAWDCDGLIRNNRIIGNSTDQSSGGGLSQCDGNIQGNTIAENAVPRSGGGGLSYCHGTIQGNVIRGNGAHGDGGGLRFCDGDVIANTISGNRAWEDGGGLSDCNGLVGRNSIIGNWTDGSGGGLHECNGKAENNIIAGNHADVAGGGISRCGGTIQNNTIAFNSCQYGSGGISSSSGTIVNCIVWGNTQGDSTANQIVVSSSPEYCCIQNWTAGGSGNISTDPLFVSPAYADYHLSRLSPCIGAGTSEIPAPPHIDIDEEKRPSGSSMDIGADEHVDIDQDELPDYWETAYFATISFGGADDPDADGLTNSQELTRSTNPNNADTDADGKGDKDEILAGTDPLYPESHFRVESVSLDKLGLTLQWPSSSGKTYQVYWSLDMRTWSRLGAPLSAMPWDTVLSFSDTQAPSRAKCFYRVRILPLSTEP